MDQGNGRIRQHERCDCECEQEKKKSAKLCEQFRVEGLDVAASSSLTSV